MLVDENELGWLIFCGWKVRCSVAEQGLMMVESKKERERGKRGQILRKRPEIYISAVAAN
jgi:hypothetical protein